MPISIPAPCLTFMILCHILSDVAEISQLRMREEALLLVPSVAQAAVFVAGQRRRHRVVSCRLRPCFRDAILQLARYHKCTGLISKISMIRRDIFDSGFAGHNRSIFNFKFGENTLQRCSTYVCIT